MRRRVGVREAGGVGAVHPPRRPRRHGLLAEPVVERAGDLALPVEHHRALLDAPHGEHRPQEPDPVLRRQVLRHGCRDVGPRLSRLRRHLAHLPFRLTGAPGSAGAPLTRRRAPRDRRCAPAVPSEDYPPSVADSERVERFWWSRLRWRMRGAWLWPVFLLLTPLEGILLSTLPPYDGAPPGVIGGALLGRLANLFLIPLLAPLLGRRRRPAGWGGGCARARLRNPLPPPRPRPARGGAGARAAPRRAARGARRPGGQGPALCAPRGHRRPRRPPPPRRCRAAGRRGGGVH